MGHLASEPIQTALSHDVYVYGVRAADAQALVRDLCDARCVLRPHAYNCRARGSRSSVSINQLRVKCPTLSPVCTMRPCAERSIRCAESRFRRTAGRTSRQRTLKNGVELQAIFMRYCCRLLWSWSCCETLFRIKWLFIALQESSILVINLS